MKWEYKSFKFLYREIKDARGFHKEWAYSSDVLRSEHQNTQVPDNFISKKEVSMFYFDDEIKLLSQFGLDKWELVSVVYVFASAGGTSYGEEKCFYFKRPLVEEDKKSEG